MSARAGTKRIEEHARERAPKGFSLIEVIVAMSLLTIVLIILANMSVWLGRRGRLNDLTTKRNLVLAQQAARIGTMPFDDLASQPSGTTMMLVGDFSFRRRLAVTPSGANRYTVKVVIEPVASEFRRDSLTLDRTRPPAGTPLCTTC
jgi:prepilin-type N-terminal cleavage/methylation domain-containing protein